VYVSPRARKIAPDEKRIRMTSGYLVSRDVVLVLAATPLIYYALATWVALKFFRRERARRLSNYTPSASVLKPVRAVDFGSYENFASFCRQDYPDFEILFAVNDDRDSALPLIQRIIQEFPERHIRLLVGAEHLGANRKVNKLARLAREAKHDVLVLSDGDVRVGPKYLRAVVAPLVDGKIGAVTSFYRAISEKNIWAEMEAVGASSDFFAGVLMAGWTEGIRFALGASIATTKERIRKIGGFEAIAGALADDYELGNRIAKAGGEVVLSPEAVWTMYPRQSTREFWDHQVRWARTVRLCRPLSYLGLLFTQGLPWMVLAALVASSRVVAASYIVGYLALRFAMAWTVGIWGVGGEVLRRKIWLVPLRDAIHFVVWLASFGSNRIKWGSTEYEIRKGQMVQSAGVE
jgi:ceramide glucosyltransferase